MRLIEKRREKIPPRCGEPHPWHEWQVRDHDENVFYASTCYLEEGHTGPHCIVASALDPDWKKLRDNTPGWDVRA